MLEFSRSLRLQLLWAAPRYFPVMWQWSQTDSPSRSLSHTWHVSAARKARQSSRVSSWPLDQLARPLFWSLIFAVIPRSAPLHWVRSTRLVAPSAHHTAPRCSNSCKPHGVAFSGYCSLRGRARAPQPWW